MPDLLRAFALAAVVLTVSGLVERAPLSFPIIFLGLGFVLGERGLGLLTLGPEDGALESIAVLTLALVLRRAAVSHAARAFIGWFGPRGLGSLLLALLVFENGVANAEFLLAVTGVVVAVSVLAHGISATPLSTLYGRAVERATLEGEREGTVAGLFGRAAEETPRIDPDELARQLEGPNPPLVLDVRTRSQYERGLTCIPGSVRVTPDEVEGWAARWISEHPDGEPHLRPIATYCT